MLKFLPFVGLPGGFAGRRPGRPAAGSGQGFGTLVQGVRTHAIFMLDPQGQVTNWNTGAERISGYTAQEIAGQHGSRVLREEDGAAAGFMERALASALRDGGFQGACVLVRKDAGRCVADLAIDPVRDGRGVLLGFAAVARDVTRERADAERVARMVRYDLLTGIGNRTFLMEKLEEACARLRRRGEPFSVLCSTSTDSRRSTTRSAIPPATRCWRRSAQRLRASLRETDVLARLGGDEFAIVQAGERQPARATRSRLRQRIIERDCRSRSTSTAVEAASAPASALRWRRPTASIPTSSSSRPTSRYTARKRKGAKRLSASSTPT